MKYFIIVLMLFSFIVHGQARHPIFDAISLEDIPEVIRLLQQGSAVFSLRNEHDMTPLFAAALMDNPALFHAMLQSVHTLPPHIIEHLLTMKNTGGETLLHMLARFPDLYDELKQLIGLVQNVDLYDDTGATPLARAVIEGNIGAIRLFLGANANLRAAPYIALAVREGQIDVINELIAAGVRITKADIEYALTRGNKKIVKLLIRNADPDILITAVTKNNLQLMALFLRFGYNPNCENKIGNTPLITAVRTHNERAIEILLRLGADPLYLTNKNTDALTEALIKSDMGTVIRFLLALPPYAHVMRDIDGQEVAYDLTQYLLIYCLSSPDTREFGLGALQASIGYGFSTHALVHEQSADEVIGVIGRLNYAILRNNLREAEELIAQISPDKYADELERAMYYALGRCDEAMIRMLLTKLNNIDVARFFLIFIGQRLRREDITQEEQEKLYDTATILVDYIGRFSELEKTATNLLTPLNDSLVRQLMNSLNLVHSDLNDEYARFVVLRLLQRERRNRVQQRESIVQKRKSEHSESSVKRIHTDRAQEQSPSINYMLTTIYQVKQQIKTGQRISDELVDKIVSFSVFLDEHPEYIFNIHTPVDVRAVPSLIQVVQELRQELDARSAAAGSEESHLEKALATMSRVFKGVAKKRGSFLFPVS